MSCFNPNKMTCFVDHSTGKLEFTFDGPAKLDNPLEYGSVENLSSSGRYQFLVPCGRCLGCRIDYSREWANRMIIELKDHKNAMFVTLTYNDEHLKFTDAGNPTLDVRDLQLFWKRLRKAFPGVRIRYYVAGEYGPSTLRPHYHAIIYGIGLSDFPDLRWVGCNELKMPYYSSVRFEKIWSNGFVQMSEVSSRTCSYVARYVLKKQYAGDQENDIYYWDQVKPFNLSSRNPGIGCLRAEEMVLSGNTKFHISCSDGVREVSLPRAFIKYCKSHKIALDQVRKLCYIREEDARMRLSTSLLASEKNFNQFLKDNEKRLADKLKLLPERR